MKKLVYGAMCALLPISAYGATGAEYPFPVNMKVSIQKGAEPLLKSGSSVVFPIINTFSVNMPNGDLPFVLETSGGDEIPMVKDGEEYLLQSAITVDEEVRFAPDPDTAGKPVRVVLEGPISLGHIHFDSGSAKLNYEAKLVIKEMAQQMVNSGLLAAYLVGTTDRAGSEDANLELSLKRARAASRYLETKLANLGALNPVIKVESMGEYESKSKDGIVDPFDRKVSVLVYPII